jgi:hypothetical protein
MKKIFRGILWFFDIMLILSGIVNLVAYFEGSFSEYTSPVISIILGVILLRYLRNSNGKKESAVDSNEISTKPEAKKKTDLLKSSVGNMLYAKLNNFTTKATEEGIEMTKCTICNVEIKFLNRPLLRMGKLNDGNEICTDCHEKIDMDDVRKFSSTEVKLIFLGEKSPGEIVKERLKTELELDSRPNTEPALEPDSSKMESAPDDSFSVDNHKGVKKKILRDKIIVFVVSLLIVGGGMAVISNWWNNLGVLDVDKYYDDPNLLIGTYRGLYPTIEYTTDMTIIIVDPNTCKIRWNDANMSWEHYSMNMDRLNNKIVLNNSDYYLVLDNYGNLTIYNEYSKITTVSKE